MTTGPYIAYKKRVLQFMRAYVPGEDLTGISIPEGHTPAHGDMIAKDIKNPSDRWLVTKEFFERNYELA